MNRDKWRKSWPHGESEGGWWWFFGTSRYDRENGTEPSTYPCEVVWDGSRAVCYHFGDDGPMSPHNWQGQWLRIEEPALPKENADEQP